MFSSIYKKSICLKTLSYENIERVVDIHVNSLPSDVLPNLGRGTINRYYCELLLLQSEQQAALFGAYEGGVLVGFCCLTKRSVGVHSLVRLDTLVNLLSMVFLNPRLFVKAVVQFWHTSSITDLAAEIAYIAVEDRVRGRGIGRLLIDCCIAYCREQGFLYIQTKTSNTRLCNHYLARYAAKIVSEFTVLGEVYRVTRWRV